MMPGDKIDPVLAWRHVEKLLRDDHVAEGDDPGDEEIERQMRAAGIRPKRIPSADEIMAHAARRARERGLEGIVPLRIVPMPAPPKRHAWAVWLVAAAIGAGIVAFVVERPVVVAWFHHGTEPIGPDPDWRPLPTPQERASAIRKEAFDACGEYYWALCESKLDEAQKLDPGGESDTRVQEARTAVHDGLKRGPVEKLKPK
jgi:hypothetical protein